MPKIFELFGFPLADNSPDALRARRTAHCCFMGRECDGGGNRDLSNVKLTDKPQLRGILALRAGVEQVPAGVCSLKLQPAERPWIVCPRRLMALSRTSEHAEKTFQATTESRLLNLLGYPVGTRLGVWGEVGLKYKEEVEGKEKTFDYHFDYILSPMVRMSLTAIEAATREPLQTLIPNLVRNGYTFSGNGFVDDFPAGRPSVIEIMTCSTSSNNKKKRTTIPMAFEDAMLGRDHNAPGINYRQVWARMVSQLIVKTEVALNWGGPALWIVQDVLVDYICSSTALDIRKFLAERIGEVNMLSLSYGDRQNADRGVIELSVGALYAGPISSAPPENARPSFQDMLRAPLKPELWRLTRLLTGKQPVNRITLR